MDNKSIKELATRYGIEINRCGTIITALEAQGCPPDLIANAIGEVLEIIKSQKCSPNEAVESWASQNHVSQTIDGIGDDLEMSLLQLSEEDEGAINQLSDLRAVHFKLRLDQQTAEKVCTGKLSDPQLQQVMEQSGKLFGTMIVQSARKHYLRGKMPLSLKPSATDITPTTKL